MTSLLELWHLRGLPADAWWLGPRGGGLPEAIGPCGITVPNGDAGALAQALEQLLLNPNERKRLLFRAPEHLARFHPTTIAKTYLNLVSLEALVILLSHPTANQNVRQAAMAFLEAGLLEEFWTCVNWKKDGLLDRLAALSARFQNELRRRSFPVELAPFIRTVPWRELGRQGAAQIGWEQLTRDEDALFSVDAVYRSLDRRVAQEVAASLTIKAIYAYDDGALDTFRAAKKRGIKCIFEHPTIYWRMVRQIQREEAELHPEWAPTLRALGDSEEKLARKDQELALADLVVTPSSFAKNSVALAPGLTAPVFVVPYGAGPVGAHPNRGQKSGKLRVLFVGALSQAKGLGYLLEAVAHLERNIEFTLIGRRVSPAVPASSVSG